MQADTKRSITSFVRRKRPEDLQAEALAKRNTSDTSLTNDGTPELHNLPEDVINPWGDDDFHGGGVFDNSVRADPESKHECERARERRWDERC